MDKLQTTSETALSQLRNIEHPDHLDLTIACFYLSLILTWFIMEGEFFLFSDASPGLWNNIPVEIQRTDTKSEFKNKLKTDLFKSYYNC